MNIYCDPLKRHDAYMLFDCSNGNPNGEPDTGEARIDPNTGHALVTDVCLKRGVRNYVDMLNDGQDVDGKGREIYVTRFKSLQSQNEKGYSDADKKTTGTKATHDVVKSVQAKMCKRFYDVRTFGAVMSVNPTAGQVRGPVQMAMARSIHPVDPYEMGITRVAVTKTSELTAANATNDKMEGKETEMGRKAGIYYGLFGSKIYFNPFYAKKSGMSETDLSLYWEALAGMWELMRSAARPEIDIRGLYVFTHNSDLGCARADDLFSRIQVSLKKPDTNPRAFSDFDVKLDVAPTDGITISRLIG